MTFLASPTHEIPARPPLPPPGPVWFPSVMGTGILATLLQLHAGRLPGAGGAAVVALAVAWGLLLFLTTAFAARSVARPSSFVATLRQPALVPFWGTVAMGILAVGSATATVLPAHFPALADWAWRVDRALWLTGTAIGVVAALGFGVRLVGTELGRPTTGWGLAVVGPMVSATTGALLVPHVPASQAPYFWCAAALCFCLSLFLGLVVFAYAYHHHWRVAPVPLVAACSSWIPLGMVGQSTAAVQALAGQGAALMTPPLGAALAHLANWYGWGMFALGIPLVAWASLVTVRGFARGMPFTPGWWALTFPIGTLALGATFLAVGTGLPAFTWLGAAVTVVLTGTVSFCLVASGMAIWRAWHR
ncbi:TDT family transporter [Buchananella hordeovulneris]|uniref:TDT family transporter n=1 Tax=Buchananella hordeovulneris TaxID=52770 RepID=UPI0026DAF73E|nr:TDT family transporter [Buchananella hordeovulneris]MDO5080541.1 TDT family transporter [Buchananella hordeovulneris]